MQKSNAFKFATLQFRFLLKLLPQLLMISVSVVYRRWNFEGVYNCFYHWSVKN